MTDPIQVIEIIITSNLYSLFIPFINTTSANDNIIKMKPIMKVSLRLFSSLVDLESAGVRKRNEIFIVMNPSSSGVYE